MADAGTRSTESKRFLACAAGRPATTNFGITLMREDFPRILKPRMRSWFGRSALMAKWTIIQRIGHRTRTTFCVGTELTPPRATAHFDSPGRTVDEIILWNPWIPGLS